MMAGMADRPIGMFDSGAGGISVLRRALDVLPGERFAYLGDSANTPYGDKPTGWIRGRCADITRALVDGVGCKAVVVACNTATAAAVDWLRGEFPETPVIGIEPAVKPAAVAFPNGKVLVMATQATLSLDRWHMLADRWGGVADVIDVPCPGLADRIEMGDLGDPDVGELIEGFVGGWRGKVDAAVLGCTHYPFVGRQIRRALGGVPLFDGAEGTARRLRSVLADRGWLRPCDGLRGAPAWGRDEAADALGRCPGAASLAAPSDIDRRVLLLTSGTGRHLDLYDTLLAYGPMVSGDLSAAYRERDGREAATIFG